MRHVDAAHAGVRWEGSFTVTEPGRWTFTVEAWTDAFASWREELDRKVAAGVEDLSGELSEGVLLLERVCRPRRGRRPRDARAGAQRRARHHRADPHPRGGGAGARPPATPPSARPTGWSRRSCRSPSSSTSTASVPGSAPGTSCSRARGAGSRASAAQLPRLAELGFDVLYLPPIHPIGLTNRKGANNALVAGRRRSRQPVGDRRRDRRPRRDPPGPGHARRVRRARRRGPPRRRRDLPRLRDPVLGRPPVAHGPPRVVQPPAGRDAEVRREPAQEVPGHLQRQLAVRGLAPPLAGAAGRRPVLGHARRARLPRRQPAHEADPVLGVADPQGPRPVPRRRLPRRGVHAPGDDAHAREGGLQPVLHVLHVEELALRPHRVRRASCRAAGSRSTSAPTSS